MMMMMKMMMLRHAYQPDAGHMRNSNNFNPTKICNTRSHAQLSGIIRLLRPSQYHECMNFHRCFWERGQRIRFLLVPNGLVLFFVLGDGMRVDAKKLTHAQPILSRLVMMQHLPRKCLGYQTKKKHTHCQKLRKN